MNPENPIVISVGDLVAVMGTLIVVTAIVVGLFNGVAGVIRDAVYDWRHETRDVSRSTDAKSEQ